MRNLIRKMDIEKIDDLLDEKGLGDLKEEYILHFTGHRVSTIDQLTSKEADSLLALLCHHSPKEQVKRRIVTLAYEAGIIYGETAADHAINEVKLDRYLKKRFWANKPLKEMDSGELLRAMDKLEYSMKCRVKAKDAMQAYAQTTKLLTELNITVK